MDIEAPVVKFFLSWLNRHPWKEVIEAGKSLQLDVLLNAELGRPSNSIPCEKEFNLASSNLLNDLPYYHLYATEEDRKEEFALLYSAKPANDKEDAYIKFCKKNLVPVEMEDAGILKDLECAQQHQRVFLKNIIRGDDVPISDFFNKVYAWYNVDYGRWERKDRVVVYKFQVLPSFGQPAGIIGLTYRLLANMVLVQYSPELEYFGCCQECGEFFYAEQKNKKFCSDACKMKNYRRRKKA